MSIPDGSRQSTSPRSDSAIRSVGRSRIDGASAGTLSSERRSPNWRLPSISTVRWLELAEGDREVERDGRLADPALRREDAHHAVRARSSWIASNSLRALRDPGHQVEAGERHRQDAVDAERRVGLDRVLRHGQDDDRDAELGLVDLLDELGALDPALEQRVDEDDVGPQLPDRGDRPRAVGQHVEQLDPGLGVQQAADVLGDLWHVLDDEQARLITLGHRPRRYHGAATGDPPGGPGRPDRPPRAARQGSDGEQDRPLAAGPDRAHVVAAGEHLDDQPGVLGEAAQLVGRDQPEAVAADPAARRAALAALLEDRRQGDAARSRRRAGRSRPW